MLTLQQRDTRFWVLFASAAAVGVAVLGLTFVVFQPLLFGKAPAPEEVGKKKVELPPYDVKPLHGRPVQHDGRAKPFETAAIEIIRHVIGRTSFEGKDPVAIVLSWWMTGGTPPAADDPWEKHPFILCEHQGLRARLYEGVPPDEEEDEKKMALEKEERLHGKYISPADLRRSPALIQLLNEAHELRRQDPDKAQHLMSPEQRNAEEVVRRLMLYDHVCGRPCTELGKHVISGGEIVPRENASLVENRLRQHPDPLRLVALDLVPGTGWFSVGDLRHLQSHPDKWPDFMQDRVAREPQRYLSPELKHELHEFQQAVKDGRAGAKLDELNAKLNERGDAKVEAVVAAWKEGRDDAALELVVPLLRNPEDGDEGLVTRRAIHDKKRDAATLAQMTAELKALVRKQNQRVIDDLHNRATLAREKNIHPDDERCRMLNIGYLENLRPNFWAELVGWQKLPRAKIEEVLAGYGKLQRAYRSDDPEQFAREQEAFFALVQDVSDRTLIESYAKTDNAALQSAYNVVAEAEKAGDPEAVSAARAAFFDTLKASGEKEAQRYPGVGTLGLEVGFNHVQPFLWAWVIMLGALVCFIAALALRGVVPSAGGRSRPSQVLYVAGLVLFLASAAFQLYGFFVRVSISHRAPVTNMYETVIFVAFMSGLFALILELFYRRTVIILAGSLVATVALVLADQLPLTLDPKISPLVPVLRSNYWLTIHVLTIVASYAGGTLAWGLANVSLALLAFGSPSREVLKTLSTYTYRAMQIAVLLLAAGTFLGGWWAAYSWGRFWGWDPKEVAALIALVAYVIPLHMRFIGWVKDFGLAVSAILCYAAIIMSWYGVNFVLGAGLHSYGFGGGGPWWVLWAGLINILWMLIASMVYVGRQPVVPAPGAFASAVPVAGPKADPDAIKAAGEQTGVQAM